MLILSRPDVIDMDATNLQYGSTMQVRVVRQDGQPVVLLLEGELDITSMDSFERALAHVRPERETGITFDLRECTYMSVQGYEAMVRVSRQTRVEVRVTTDLACRVLALCGYEGVVRMMIPESALPAGR